MNIENVDLAESITIEPDTSLVLSGAGVRKKFMYKIYIAALYLTKKVRTAEEAILNTGPKRILFHYLYDKVAVERLIDGWRDGFKSNMNEEEHSELASQIEKFLGLLEDAYKGDITVIDYTKNGEVEVWLNEERKGVIKGAELYKSILKVLIGDCPVDDQMKNAILCQ